MSDKNETAVPLPKWDVVNATADIWAYSAEAMTRYGDARVAAAESSDSPLPHPVAVKYRDTGLRDDDKALSIWAAHQYDTGGEPLYSADQLHSYAYARVCAARRPVVAKEEVPDMTVRIAAESALACLLSSVLPLDDDDIDIINRAIINLQAALKDKPAPFDAWWEKTDGK